MQRLDVNVDNVQKLVQLLETSSRGGPETADCLQTLSNLDKLIGFRSCLLAIATNESSHFNIRIMALSYFKNSVGAFWNRNNAKQDHTTSADAESERTHLKQVLLNAIFQENHDVIANQLSDSIARIAKTDFPIHWPEILPAIMDTLSNAQSLTSSDTSRALMISRRAFDTLDQLLESLSAKRLISSRQQFEQHVVKAHFENLRGIWMHFIQLLLQALSSLAQQPSPELLENTHRLAQSGHLATKCIYRCVSTCGVLMCESQLGSTIFPMLAETMTRLAHSLSAIPATPTTVMLRNAINHIRGYAANAVADAQKDAPLQFRPYLLPFLTLYSDVIRARGRVREDELSVLALEHSQGEIGLGWTAEDSTNEELKGNDMCTIQALNFITSVLVHPSYRADNNDGGVVARARAGVTFGAGGLSFDTGAADEVRAVLDAFVTDQWCIDTVQLIVRSFLPWGRYDCQSWMDEPEAFYHRNRLNRNEVDERTAAETFLQALAVRKQTVVAALLRDWLQAVMSQEQASGGTCPGLSASGEQPYNSEVTLQRWRGAALMTALGLVVFDMKSVMDVNPLVNYVSDQVQAVVAAVSSSGTKNLVFEMTPQAVVLLQRAVWLAGQFTDVVDSATVERLCSLVVCLTQVGDPVVRLFAVAALNSYVDSVHMETIVDNFAAQRDGHASFMEFSISNLLTLCAECREYDSKVQILSCVRGIVDSVGSRVGPAVPALMQTLPTLWQSSVDDKQLRQSIISTLNSLTVSLQGRSQAMHEVFMPVLNFSIDVNNEDAAFLLESALELWRAVMQNCVEITPQLMQLFPRWIAMYGLYEDNFEVGVEILQSYVIAGQSAFLSAHASQLGPVILSLMERLGEDDHVLLVHVLDYMAQVCPAAVLQQLTPILVACLHDIRNAVMNGHDRHSHVTIAAYFQVFSHLLVHDAPATLSLVSKLGESLNTNLTGLFVESYIEYSDHMEMAFKRKHAAMALMQLLDLDQTMLRKAPALLQYVALEVVEDEIPENRFVAENLSQTPTEHRTESYRIACIAQRDPVNQCRLLDWVRHRLGQCAQTHSQAFVQAMVDSLRPDLRAALQG